MLCFINITLLPSLPLSLLFPLSSSRPLLFPSFPPSLPIIHHLFFSPPFISVFPSLSPYYSPSLLLLPFPSLFNPPPSIPSLLTVQRLPPTPLSSPLRYQPLMFPSFFQQSQFSQRSSPQVTRFSYLTSYRLGLVRLEVT